MREGEWGKGIRILGGRLGWGRGIESRPPRVQGKDQIPGVGGWEGQKGKPEEQLGIPGVRGEGTWGIRENQG